MSKTIQWFPGHMTRAMRDMEEKRELCDGVICVLDARAPAATFNKNLKKIFGGKPILYLLNKADLADGGAEGFRKLLAEKGRNCVLCNAADNGSKRSVFRDLSLMTEEKGERVAVAESRAAIAYYTKGMEGSAQVRGQMNTAESAEQIIRILTDFMQKMPADGRNCL